MIGTAILSAFFAACAASGVTFVIERYGGVVGGVLGSSPTTVVPASIGLALSTVSWTQLQQALYSIPLGMSVNVIFLLLWREIPEMKWYSTYVLSSPTYSTLYYQLLIMILITLSAWAVGGTIMLSILDAITRAQVSHRVPGLLAAIFLVVIGVSVCYFKPVPAPKGTNKVANTTHILRGIMAGIAILVSVLIAQINSFAAGLASTFPAIFLTSMISLWLSQGSAVKSGAVGPMMLGSFSVTGFALSFAEILPRLAESMSGLGGAIALTTLLSYIIAICCCSLPSFYFLRWVRSRLEAEQPPAENASADADHANKSDSASARDVDTDSDASGSPEKPAVRTYSRALSDPPAANSSVKLNLSEVYDTNKSSSSSTSKSNAVPVAITLDDLSLHDFTYYDDYDPSKFRSSILETIQQTTAPRPQTKPQPQPQRVRMNAPPQPNIKVKTVSASRS